MLSGKGAWSPIDSVTGTASVASRPQVAFDAGAKRVVLPNIPAELFTKFQTAFYADPVDAVMEVLGAD